MILFFLSHESIDRVHNILRKNCSKRKSCHINCFQKSNSCSILNASDHENIFKMGYLTFRSFMLKFRKSITTAQKMKFPVKDLFSKYEQIFTFLHIPSYLLKKLLMENFIFVLWILIKTLSRKSSRFLDLQDCTYSYESFRSSLPESFL